MVFGNTQKVIPFPSPKKKKKKTKFPRITKTNVMWQSQKVDVEMLKREEKKKDVNWHKT